MKSLRAFGYRVKEPLPQDAMVQRLSSLQVIGVGSIAAGFSLGLTEPPLAGLSFFGGLPGWPWMYGFSLAMAGLAIFVGSWRRRPRMTFFGALLGAAWYNLFAAGLILQWRLWTLGLQVGTNRPPVHQAWIYLTVGAILIGHVIVIGKTRRIENLGS